MILIAHRGNTRGKNIDFENKPEYLVDAIKDGFNVEADVWLVDNKFYLGHDNPDYLIDTSFLKLESVWCHAKNIEALEKLLLIGAHCFWHQEDSYTLTSRGFIWAYPGSKLCEKSICVMPENTSYSSESLFSCAGICTDFVYLYRNKVKIQ